MRNLIVIVLFSFVPFMIQGQVTVANATPGVIQVEGVSIPSRSLKPIQADVRNGIVAVNVEYYEGLQQKGPTMLYREIDKKNRAVIRDFDVNQELASQFKQMSPEKQNQKTETYNVRNISASASGDWWSNVTVHPENKMEDYSIFVPTDPFRGLALKPGQKSAKSITLKTGKILFPVFLSVEEDENTATGVRFTWALVNKIITEGQDVFEFTPADIMEANNGKVIIKKIFSEWPTNVIISQGKSRGEVIPPKSLVKLELFLGWNIIPIQFMDEDGLPTEAILVLLVNDLRSPIFGKQGNDGRISINAENIYITDVRR